MVGAGLAVGWAVLVVDGAGADKESMAFCWTGEGFGAVTTGATVPADVVVESDCISAWVSAGESGTGTAAEEPGGGSCPERLCTLI